MPKFRSPNYPAISLREALARVTRLFKEARQSVISEETAVKAIGYSGLTGPSRSTLSALKKYGLVEDAPGGVRVSKIAMGILHSTSDDEREQSIRKAALTPELFRRFMADYGDVSDQILRSHLVREGFSDDGATKAIRAYRETVEFANLSQGDAILEAAEEHDPEPEPELTTKPPATNPNPRRDPPALPAFTDAAAFVWPLPKGRRAELRVSGGRFTRADLLLLKQYLALAEMTVSDEDGTEADPTETSPDEATEWSDHPIPSVRVGQGVAPAGSGPEPVRP